MTLKFAEVSAGKPNCAENAFASDRIVSVLQISKITTVCPFPLYPALYSAERL